jgi:hypothetical protein
MNMHIQSLDLYFDLLPLQINTAYTFAKKKLHIVTGPKIEESTGPAPSLKKQNFFSR